MRARLAGRRLWRLFGHRRTGGGRRHRLSTMAMTVADDACIASRAGTCAPPPPPPPLRSGGGGNKGSSKKEGTVDTRAGERGERLASARDDRLHTPLAPLPNP